VGQLDAGAGTESGLVTEDGAVEGAGLEGGVVVGEVVWLGDVRVGDAVADRDGLDGRVSLGAGDDGRTLDGVTLGAGRVEAGVTAGWTGAAGADAGRTRTYRASTPTNSTTSVMVEVRGRRLRTDLPSCSGCRLVMSRSRSRCWYPVRPKRGCPPGGRPTRPGRGSPGRGRTACRAASGRPSGWQRCRPPSAPRP
jgi:hypothetical protein